MNHLWGHFKWGTRKQKIYDRSGCLFRLTVTYDKSNFAQGMYCGLWRDMEMDRYVSKMFTCLKIILIISVDWHVGSGCLWLNLKSNGWNSQYSVWEYCMYMYIIVHSTSRYVDCYTAWQILNVNIWWASYVLDAKDYRAI